MINFHQVIDFQGAIYPEFREICSASSQSDTNRVTIYYRLDTYIRKKYRNKWYLVRVINDNVLNDTFTKEEAVKRFTEICYRHLLFFTFNREIANGKYSGVFLDPNQHSEKERLNL